MSVKVEGLEELFANIDREKRHSRTRINNALLAIGDVAVYEVAKRTPFLEGLLTAGIERALDTEANGDPCVIIRVPLNSPAAPYAIRMHEDIYNLGDLSVKKQARTGKEVGRKYIVRGVIAGHAKYKLIIKTRLGVK